MKKYWASFWLGRGYGGFELHSPWWFSGQRCIDVDDGEDTVESSVCAAVLAESEDQAREVILGAFDTRPVDLEFRFVEPRPDDWTPFGSRFARAAWMKWDD